MRELDVLLTRYLDRDFAAASRPEREAFVRLLGLQDPDLAAYLLAGAPVIDPQFAPLVARIREP